MKNTLDHLISQLHRKRLLSLFIQLASLSILTGVFTSVFTGAGSILPYIFAGIFFLAGVGIFTVTGKSAKPSPREITRFLDRSYPFMEESASLLLADPPEMTIKHWQKEKISERLTSNASGIKLPNDRLKKSAAFAGLWLMLAMALFASKPALNRIFTSPDTRPQAGLQEEDFLSEGGTLLPGIHEVQISVTPPLYTGKPPEEFGFENISVPEQSEVTWSLKPEGPVESVNLRFSNNETQPLTPNGSGDLYTVSMTAAENRIYQAALSNADTTIYSSFKSMEVVADQPPAFAVKQPEEKRDYITPQKRAFEIEAEIGDDYGITAVMIRATLARGSGENVRFREQSFSFDHISGLGSAEVEARTTLNTDSLEMEPGDELYFYITATDNKPDPQTARSDTYFIIYADSSEISGVEIAGLGVDLLPEYFRSQRQIIIDTEQLLEDKPDISIEEFNERSEAVGYDQNLLRQRYGNYLGQEDEGLPAATGEGGDEHGDAHDHAGEEDGDDDHEEENLNEMGLENAESEAAGIIPDEFFHDHGAAEMNTLFAESPRAMLKQALDNMWNAELYLRTRRPEEALPYEYAALELLKAVQQANRQYTRKAGYELPPISEDEKRLTGTYDDFANPDGETESGRPANPLEQLQLLFRDETLRGNALAEKARALILEAELTDASRLFLLNRIRTIENEGRSDDTEQQIIQLVIELSSKTELDPAPAVRPSLRQIQVQE